MENNIIQVAYGCLLHDVGKLVYRGNVRKGNHSAAGAEWLKEHAVTDATVLDCVRYHHQEEIKKTSLSDDSLAYITYIADDISAASDRREIESDTNRLFDKMLSLQPVFTHLKGEHGGRVLPLLEVDNHIRMPMDGAEKARTSEYVDLLNLLAKSLPLSLTEKEVNPLLSALETLTSRVPSSTCTQESADISLFHHLKTTTAIGCCIAAYLAQKQTTDYKKMLFRDEKKFDGEKAFLLFSADFSGIQKFIYTVSTKNALKSLRSRSFFLELAMEHYIDELLTVCGMCRANLLYSGGGHCYLLLPNTDEVRQNIDTWTAIYRKWLMNEFGISLYLACGYTECSANELMNQPAEQAPYQDMFRRVSRQIAYNKLHRYRPDDILMLNNRKNGGAERECRVCGRVGSLIRDKDGDTYSCPWCHTFESISSKIIGDTATVYLVSATGSKDCDFSLPSHIDGTMYYVRLTNETSAHEILKTDSGMVRIYTKNKPFPGATKLYVGDYASSNSISELAQNSVGIKRYAVCRMDVDDLGQAFVDGFQNQSGKTPVEKNHFVTISRTSAFSGEMSMFFKNYVNGILDGNYDKEKLNVTVVYSGGDDVFLVGAWNDTIKAALKIRKAFREYTCGALTISCGIGLFTDHYPIRIAAAETAELEDASKHIQEKDSITLFTAEGHTYRWDVFEKDIQKKMISQLSSFFDGNDERGNSLLYHLLDLLRETEQNGKLSLARFAYVLTRLEPPKSSPKSESYHDFEKQMYAWALNETERRKLITAIYIYVYQNRGGKS